MGTRRANRGESTADIVAEIRQRRVQMAFKAVEGSAVPDHAAQSIKHDVKPRGVYR